METPVSEIENAVRYVKTIDSMMESIFKFKPPEPTGEELRDKGIAKAARARCENIVAAQNIAYMLGQTMSDVTADDVRVIFQEHHPELAWGEWLAGCHISTTKEREAVVDFRWLPQISRSVSPLRDDTRMEVMPL